MDLLLSCCVVDGLATTGPAGLGVETVRLVGRGVGVMIDRLVVAISGFTLGSGCVGPAKRTKVNNGLFVNKF